jgi:hypothetical protein
MTAKSSAPYLVFGFKLSPALVVAWAGAEDVPLELPVALVEVPDVVAVVKVLALAVAFDAEPLAAPVVLEVKVLAVEEVWIRTPPEEVLEVPDLVAEAEAEPDALLPELEPQVPLDLMLCQLPVKSE